MGCPWWFPEEKNKALLGFDSPTMWFMFYLKKSCIVLELNKYSTGKYYKFTNFSLFIYHQAGFTIYLFLRLFVGLTFFYFSSSWVHLLYSTQLRHSQISYFIFYVDFLNLRYTVYCTVRRPRISSTIEK